jgi:hypothetical protein
VLQDSDAPRAFQIDHPHFGYGSNMWPPWLWKDAPSAQGVGRARLDRWALVFRKTSRDGSAEADIRRASSAFVWGALFEIAERDIHELNEKEDGYEPTLVMVRLPSGKTVEAWTFITVSKRTRGRRWPFNWYLDLVCKGATHFGLPQRYVRALRARRGKPDHDERRMARVARYLAANPVRAQCG